MLYYYNAYVVGVYDGDTITVDIDLGFGVCLRKQKLRLIGINAPEVRGEQREQGLRTRDWLRKRILHRDVIVETSKDRKGKYGRWLALVRILDPGQDEYSSVNNELVQEGLAEYMEYD